MLNLAAHIVTTGLQRVNPDAHPPLQKRVTRCSVMYITQVNSNTSYFTANQQTASWVYKPIIVIASKTSCCCVKCNYKILLASELTFWHRSFTFKFWHTLYVKCE